MSGQRTFSDWLRYQFRGATDWAGRFGVRLGINPDFVTIAGLVVVAAASTLVAQGQFLLAALLLLLGMPLDVWDGAIARAMKRKNRFGAFLDSTLDRYADGFLLLGLAYYFSAAGRQPEMIVTGLALIGAFAVSYTRARAEGLQIPCKEGIFSRTERTIVQIVMLLTGWLVPGIVILAVGNNLTALQRMLLVYRETRKDEVT